MAKAFDLAFVLKSNSLHNSFFTQCSTWPSEENHTDICFASPSKVSFYHYQFKSLNVQGCS
jgi:hypothetical protein